MSPHDRRPQENDAGNKWATGFGLAALVAGSMMVDNYGRKYNIKEDIHDRSVPGHSSSKQQKHQEPSHSNSRKDANHRPSHLKGSRHTRDSKSAPAVPTLGNKRSVHFELNCETDPPPKYSKDPVHTPQTLVTTPQHSVPLPPAIQSDWWTWHPSKKLYYHDSADGRKRHYADGTSEDIKPPAPAPPPEVSWDEHRKKYYWPNPAGKCWQYEDGDTIPYSV